jgi:hypothetical protein
MAQDTTFHLHGFRPRAASGGPSRLWHRFMVLFDPYRPELHYMRGPGPKWRAKHGSES